MAKILVTGGAGFIGSNLVDALIQKGHEVLIIDNLSTGKRENINSRAEFVLVDLRDFDLIKDLFKGVDYVFHEAALPRIPLSIEKPQESNDINIKATLNVLVAARDAGVKRLIYAASSSALGSNNKIPMKEDGQCYPLNPYSLQKYVGELYCKIFSNIYGLPTVTLRYFNVYGPRQPREGSYVPLIGIFLTQKKKGEKLTITGDGKQTRDFCVTGDALILMDNFSWKPIRDIKPGERVISFDEHAINKKRRFKISEVKAKSSYISSNVYEIKTEKGRVRATGNHPWLMPKRGYRETLQLKRNMKNYKNQKLRKFSEPVFIGENTFYKIGYIAGAIEGDGYISYHRYPNKSTLHRVALEVSDKEFRDVVHSYFQEMGLNPILHERQFKYLGSKRTYITQSNHKKDYQKILKILKNKKLKNKDFCRGYLAGIFDSEGEFDRWNLRISNKDQSIINNIKNILRQFNFEWSEYKRKDDIIYIKILGGLNEHVRFFALFQPKITRKRPKLETREVKGGLVKIISINKVPNEKVYNLEIEKTSTYMANGFLCHNTHVADVVRANILAMESDKVGKGEVINIGGGKNHSVNEIAEMVGGEAIHIPARPGEMQDTLADITKAKELLGWQPEITLEEGIKNLLE